MNDSLKLNSEWGLVNRVNFNACQMQCILSIKSQTWADVNLEKSKDPDILGMKINCKVRQSKYIIVPLFLKNVQELLYFIWSPHYFHDDNRKQVSCKGRGLSLLWGFLNPYRKRRKCLLMAVGHITLLEHCRNMVCVPLFYRYCKGLCSGELGNRAFENHVSTCCSNVSRRTHPFVVDWPGEWTVYFRDGKIHCSAILSVYRTIFSQRFFRPLMK